MFLTPLLAIACSEPRPERPVYLSDDLPVEIVEASAAQVSPERSVYTLTWSTPEPADAVVEYGEDGAFDHVVEATSSADGLTHAATLAALAAATIWEARVVSTGERAVYQSEPMPIGTAAAPETLPVLELVSEPDPDVTGFALTIVIDEGVQSAALLDREGRYVWWQEIGASSSFRAGWDPADETVYWVRGDGETSSFWRTTLAGEPERLATLPITHHDFTRAPDGGWYFICYDAREVDEDGHDDDRGGEGGDGGDGGDGHDDDEITVYGDQIVYLSPAGKETRTIWSSWDEYPYQGETMAGERGEDWPHTNSLAVDPVTGELWVSIYMADTLALVDPEDGSVVERFGGDDSDWEIPDGEGFARQHSPYFSEGGSRLVFFDNGADGDRAEAVAYDLDRDARKADRTLALADGEHRYVTKGSAVPVGDDLLVSWGSEGTLNLLDAEGGTRMEVDTTSGDFGYTAHVESIAGATW